MADQAQPDNRQFVLRGAALAAGSIVFALATVTMADSDLWGHLRFGLDVLQTWRLPFDDPYSFTQDRPWINHEWLSELAMGIAWTAGGSVGLALLKGLLTFGALALVWRALRGTRLAARMLIFAGAAAATAPLTRTMRPQLWTCLFLAILCTVLVEHRERARKWLPLLFAVWANMHGGWIVGMGVLGVWGAVEVLERPPTMVRWVLLLLACVLATLVTPYGWGLWEFLATTVRMGRDITEWQPTFSLPFVDWIPWLSATAFGLWLFRRPVPDRLGIAGVLVMLAYSSARVARIGPLFVEALVVLGAGAIRQSWPQPEGRAVIEPSRHDRLAVVFVCQIAIGTAGALGRSSLTCIRVDAASAPDAAAIALLQQMPSGRLVTFFDWGEYALWHVSPRIKVSMDGRRETVYTDVRLNEHAAVLEGTAEGLALLEEWRPEYVWLPATSATTKGWLVAERYRIDFESARSFVAIRADLPAVAQPAAQPVDPRCFPD